MMKKNYESPVFLLVTMQSDVITASNGRDNEVDFTWNIDELKGFYS